ncbi:H-2 class II histocompatibility antigen gamma chain-like isoform X1 [Carcharodon carcharias]|uniref:H-2 class II histocompatibility antigen gamma chain-like isoform X1 n=1 Tax=Carcharodon carcharias TaxID=13397 RepID=UPI001B7EE50F|nr:H-2 class II histocompatibility antigen gamma chain-like isoform X1 [Carcharodon carcharias]
MSVDEQQNSLLNNSQQDLISNSNVEARTTVTGQSSRKCSRSLLWGGVTVLAAMLIAGQVVSVMFLLKQQDKITDLQKTTDRIENKYSSSRSPVRPRPIMHFRPMMMDMPIAYIDPNMEKPKVPKSTPSKPMTLLEKVQELLEKENTTKNIPEFNSTFPTNLKLLRDSMTESDWQDFNTWLKNWLLFQLIQEKKEAAPTPSAPQPQPEPQPQPIGRRIYSSIAMKPMMVDLPKASDTKETNSPDAVPESKVLKVETDCERHRKESKIVPGAYRPSCDEKGNYEVKQCWPSTGYCWCTYPNGTKVEGTDTRHQLNCKPH